MRLLLGLFLLAIAGVAFFVWRAIARSPKLDRLFNFAKRDETATDIIGRQRTADRDLNTRGRTLSKKQSELANELNRIKRNQQ